MTISSQHRRAWACIAVIAVMLAGGARAERPTLYQRLGAFDGIARFVDTAFPRVAAHPDLRHLFRGHSLDSAYRQRQLIVDALCKAAGGPCVYIGRDLRKVHVGLQITDAEWSTFLGVLGGAMDDLEIRGQEKKDFLALIGSFRPDVVEKP